MTENPRERNKKDAGKAYSQNSKQCNYKRFLTHELKPAFINYEHTPTLGAILAGLFLECKAEEKYQPSLF